MILEQLRQSLENGEFGSLEATLLIDDILNEQLNLDDEDTILEPEEARIAAKIVDELFNFAERNCTENQELIERMEKYVSSYLDTISRSLLYEDVAGDEAKIISEDNFDLLSKKTTECEIEDLELAISSLSPNITLKSLSDDPKDC